MDKDHSAGVANLLTRLDADVLIVPPVSMEIDCGGVLTLAADREISFQWSNSKLTVYGEKLLESNNENSICILFDTEKCDILITGDRDWEAEARLLQKVQLPKVDVLIAGHHGSAYATSEQLLDTVCPQIVCISVGADNIYGHPAAQTLKRLQAHGCDIYRTDLHGTISLRR
jgi:competence protein ComEC